MKGHRPARYAPRHQPPQPRRQSKRGVQESIGFNAIGPVSVASIPELNSGGLVGTTPVWLLAIKRRRAPLSRRGDMKEDIDAQCARIVEKLRQAVAADPTFAVFGASRHNYAIGPTVSEETIRAFESGHGIALPEHYRAFLKKVGNGGPGADNRVAAGPFYGIFALGLGIHEFIDGDGDHFGIMPFIRPDMPRSEWEEAIKRLDSDRRSGDYFDRVCGRVFRGLLPIGHQGCQNFHALVLQGPERGRVVNVDIELSPPVFCFEANFLDWYERWLDEIVSGILLKKGPTWFGYRMGGDDTQLLKVFKETDDKTEKLAALDGFGKLTAISAKSTGELPRIAACDDPDLRRKAVVILTEFAYALARHPLEDLLEGPEEDQLTACESIHSFAKDHATEWIDRVGPIAAKTNNSELFRSASYVLEASGADCSHYLLPATSHQDEAIRQRAIQAIGKGVQTSETIDAILKGLSDEAPGVVHAALQAHDKPFDDRFFEVYAAIASRFKVDEHYILTNLGYCLKAAGYASVDAFMADFEAKMGRRQVFQWRVFGREG